MILEDCNYLLKKAGHWQQFASKLCLHFPRCFRGTNYCEGWSRPHMVKFAIRLSSLPDTAELLIWLRMPVVSCEILRQYDGVISGREIVRQHDSMPHLKLYKSTCKLGRLYIEEGLRCAACVCWCLGTPDTLLILTSGVGDFRQREFRFCNTDRSWLEKCANLRLETSDCQIIVERLGEDNEHHSACSITRRNWKIGQSA